ncbi:MAG: FHA domain-containing protein [Alphaproteobacteria bacterium]|nr:FHA domain-containing protein [Alphaproteobacteria bacterium]
MGLLRSASGEISALGARSTAGRSHENALIVRDSRVSAQHAAFAWDGHHWTVRDLGSRNGTFVDGRRVGHGERVVLQLGSSLWLAGPDLAWTLTDAGPPRACACSETEVVAADGDLMLLPDATTAEVAVFRESDGLWRVEEDGDLRVVRDGETVTAAGRAWVLRLPTGVASTPTVGVDAPPELVFRVSSDEEYVEMDLTTGGQTHRLKARSFLYLLLTLARLANEPDADGWIDREELARMLRIESKTVDVHIHRARAAMADVGEGLAARLIERRVGTRQLRLGLAVRAIATC